METDLSFPASVIGLPDDLWSEAISLHRRSSAQVSRLVVQTTELSTNDLVVPPQDRRVRMWRSDSLGAPIVSRVRSRPSLRKDVEREVSMTLEEFTDSMHERGLPPVQHAYHDLLSVFRHRLLDTGDGEVHWSRMSFFVQLGPVKSPFHMDMSRVLACSFGSRDYHYKIWFIFDRDHEFRTYRSRDAFAFDDSIDALFESGRSFNCLVVVQRPCEVLYTPACMAHAVLTVYREGTAQTDQYCLAGGYLFCTQEDIPYMMSAPTRLPIARGKSKPNLLLYHEEVRQWARFWPQSSSFSQNKRAQTRERKRQKAMQLAAGRAAARTRTQ